MRSLSKVSTQDEMRLRFVIRGEKTANSNWAQGKGEEAMNVFRRQTLHNAARSEALLASEIAAPMFLDDYHRGDRFSTKIIIWLRPKYDSTLPVRALLLEIKNGWIMI